MAAGLIEGNETDHVDVEAFGEDEPGAYWRGHPRKREIIRAAYWQALELALGPETDSRSDPKPIVTYWVRGVPKFEAIVSETPREVHVMWLTPSAPPPNPPPAGNEFPENMWLISTPEAINDLREPLPKDYTYNEPFPVLGLDGVECWRLVGY